jgi:hypothetical protein
VADPGRPLLAGSNISGRGLGAIRSEHVRHLGHEFVRDALECGNDRENPAAASPTAVDLINRNVQIARTAQHRAAKF